MLVAMAVCGTAFADQEVGKVVAVRGKATLHRGRSVIDAKVRTGIMGSDTIQTGADSRAKLLFIDDSVLTLSDNSKLSITEFIKGKAGERGSSVFNLLDGKMRSVVGKTKFEVKTPTAVAAARGTVIFFDVSPVKNLPSSKIICLEGTVQVRSTAPTLPGTLLLTPGKMVVFTQGSTTMPKVVPAPPAELRKARTDTSSAGLPEEKKSDSQADNKSDKGSSSDKGSASNGGGGDSSGSSGNGSANSGSGGSSNSSGGDQTASNSGGGSPGSTAPVGDTSGGGSPSGGTGGGPAGPPVTEKIVQPVQPIQTPIITPIQLNTPTIVLPPTLYAPTKVRINVAIPTR
jgi:hypothetical protein